MNLKFICFLGRTLSGDSDLESDELNAIAIGTFFFWQRLRRQEAAPGQYLPDCSQRKHHCLHPLSGMDLCGRSRRINILSPSEPDRAAAEADRRLRRSAAYGGR